MQLDINGQLLNSLYLTGRKRGRQLSDMMRGVFLNNSEVETSPWMVSILQMPKGACLMPAQFWRHLVSNACLVPEFLG